MLFFFISALDVLSRFLVVPRGHFAGLKLYIGLHTPGGGFLDTSSILTKVRVHFLFKIKKKGYLASLIGELTSRCFVAKGLCSLSGDFALRSLFPRSESQGWGPV